MSTAVDRAIKNVAGHPRVLECQTKVREDQTVAANIEIDVGLGSRWLAKGRGENGVRAIEPVKLLFFPDYPLSAPSVFLRMDFERNLPHMFPSKPDQQPSPCHVDGDAAEFLHRSGINAFIDQIHIWLNKAAHDCLIDPEQGWEPVRRDEAAQWLVADADFLREQVTKDAGASVMKTTGAVLALGTDYARPQGICHNDVQALSDAFMTQSVQQACPALTLFAWPGKNADGSPFIDTKYRAETLQDLQGLLERAELSGCREPLEARLKLLATRFGDKTSSVPMQVWIVLATRRPMHIRDQKSDIELSAFLLLASSREELSPSTNRPVFYARQLNAVTPMLLRAMSDLDEQKRLSWTLLGCGSLGSKIALHLGRQGDAPKHLVDNFGTAMLPHNYSRHALLPVEGYAGETGGVVSDLWFLNGKAIGLADAMRALGHSSQPINCDLSRTDFGSRNGRPWDKKDDFLVETTGSERVADHLSNLKIIHTRPPIIEASLMAAGKLGLFLQEGQDKNPSAGELRTDLYRHFYEDQELGTLAFDKPGRAVAIGQGCVSVTATMSDANLSAVAAPMADLISEILEDGFAAPTGQLHICRTQLDGVSRTWAKIEYEPFLRLSDHSGNSFASVSADVQSKIDKAIRQNNGLEIGGILMGRFIEQTNSFVVVDLVDPPPDSQSSRKEFILGVEGVRAILDEYVRRSNGSLYPVGTWHSHPTDTSASSQDYIAGIQLALGQSFPLIELIRTPKSWKGFIADSSSSSNTVSIVEIAEFPAEGANQCGLRS